jgi:hypothetical protein
MYHKDMKMGLQQIKPMAYWLISYVFKSILRYFTNGDNNIYQRNIRKIQFITYIYMC